MTARILSPAEWPRLAETDLDVALWTQVDPGSSLQIVVVENAERQIVACWATMACRHVEGFWVRPDHQKRGGVLRRLFVAMREVLLGLGATSVVTHAETPAIADLLIAAGATRWPGESFVLPVDFGPWAKG